MARSLLVAVALVCLMSLACGQDLKWSDLKNFTGQWNIDFSLTKTADKSVFVPHNCTGFKEGVACNEPVMNPDKGDMIKVHFQLKDALAPFRTHNGLTPKKMLVKLCYSNATAAGRPWRKFKDIVKKDKNCKFEVGKTSFTNGSSTYGWNISHEFIKEMPTGVYFVRVTVRCDDGSKDGVICQYDNTKVKDNYFELHKGAEITSGMRTAVAVCSAIGPLFLIGFFVVDSILKRKQV